ncbi:folate-sensitive fragile site protein Fra10Ac1-domain-containing protein [Lentinula lateritia]|uniref:Folate-sensitive fragile site protein Fra10Ac1-domain-containing protein n=1 Tax=Lentinula lateritia TaxID=40482 RepID=A0ABQ8VZ85_9AGAR|nr:folate-sensitive fragile site protein Fra10Ac1-domain-containing protein [Lentinula lateritia]
MALYSYGSSSKGRTMPQGKTEFEILKDSHKFLREDEDDNSHLSWEEKLASKYYSSLYREFAMCDLKHYKSGNFALRWRTEDEVLAGLGESTCGNTRCKHYTRTSTSYDNRSEVKKPALSTLELPFAYSEHGENRSALVKVVLCARCVDKLMWKRRQSKEKETKVFGRDSKNHEDKGHGASPRADESSRNRNARTDHWDREDREKRPQIISKRRHSRSRSPQSHIERKRSKHR